MTLLAILTSLVFAQDFDQDFDQGSYKYRIFNVTVEDKRWTVQASKGQFDCKATIKCVGLKAPMIFRSYKPTWNDPLVIFYLVDLRLKSCELKSCKKVRKLTYADLKTREPVCLSSP